MGRGSEHWNYQKGKYVNETIRREFRNEHRYCEQCKTDLLNANRWQWVLHHKDHNHFNNDPSNWQLLCKRCHQIEHECWLAFEGATTISKESTAK